MRARDMIMWNIQRWPIEYQINNSFNLIGGCQSPKIIGDYKCVCEREYKPYNQLSKFSKIIIIIIINNEIYEEGMMVFRYLFSIERM